MPDWFTVAQTNSGRWKWSTTTVADVAAVAFFPPEFGIGCGATSTSPESDNTV